MQEVVEGLLAGAEFYNRETDDRPSPVRQGERDIELPSAKNDGAGDHIMTTVDVEWQDKWKSPVYDGAWRRVVMNLFGNAPKYAKTGYIRLFMWENNLAMPEKSRASAVRITINDSGRGMSKDFLLHHLYFPLLQETHNPLVWESAWILFAKLSSLEPSNRLQNEPNHGTDVESSFRLALPSPTRRRSCHISF